MVVMPYFATPSASASEPTELTADKLAIAMRGFFRITELWGLTNEQAMILLGRPGRATFFRWKRSDVRNLSHDTVMRISYIFGAYKALQLLFKNPRQADEWVQKPNAAFGGQSALQRMLGGDVTDLFEVRRYLDAVRGGMA